ncbi:hypothetical protein [Niallia sp. FSL K6-0077]|uniref:hypothetical protein n=1 Tax=Niallia sp. FSL K6-0077 TaxID=2954743 RepID=UPI0030F9CFCD
MWEWITENKVFSGIGGTILTLGAGYITYLFNKNRKKEEKTPTQSIQSGANSNNVQGGNDVNVTIGDKNVRK